MDLSPIKVVILRYSESLLFHLHVNGILNPVKFFQSSFMSVAHIKYKIFVLSLPGAERHPLIPDLFDVHCHVRLCLMKTRIFVIKKQQTRCVDFHRTKPHVMSIARKKRAPYTD